jgi:hypothetical protein
MECMEETAMAVENRRKKRGMRKTNLALQNQTSMQGAWWFYPMPLKRQREKRRTAIGLPLPPRSPICSRTMPPSLESLLFRRQ